MLLRGYFDTEDDIGVTDLLNKESVEGECKNSTVGMFETG